MATNPYFHTAKDAPQQNLMEDIVIEFIKMSGMDVLYIMREDDGDPDSDGLDTLFGEDNRGVYKRVFPMEMYLETVDDFSGDGDLYRKFGLQINNSADLIVSRTRFIQETGRNAPREGDLIYLPITNSLFEIKFVDTDNAFYQFGKLYTNKLSIENFQYSGEVFQTGYPNIDEIAGDRGYTIEINLDAGGSGAFVDDEAVLRGGLTVGYVQDFDADALTLWLYHPVGEFVSTGYLEGSSSGASWGISAGDILDLANDPFAGNEEFETGGQDILDWSEDSPFGDQFGSL